MAALRASDPSTAVSRFCHRSENLFQIGEKEYDLREFGNIYLIGAGKAGVPMAHSIAQSLGNRLTSGIIVVKQGNKSMDKYSLPQEIIILEAGHPIPDQRSLYAAQRIDDFLSNCQPEDLVICVISGGGSALLISPVTGISLTDLQDLTNRLLASGASIDEINTLRKHLDTIKGGGLARRVFPAQLVTLILSDVIGNSLDVIASGPTVADTSTFKQAYKVLERYQLHNQVPSAIVDYLNRGLQGDVMETPKPGDPLFAKVQNIIVGSNYEAAHSALETAKQSGFNSLLLTTFLQGEARQIGRVLASITRQIDSTAQPLKRPACVIAGGETTVTLLGNGLGGRNQEVALAAVYDLAGVPDIALVTLATDGNDGPTDAAGAIVTGSTLDRAFKLGVDPNSYLARNDSYHFFEALDDLLITGPTLTNVNDLNFIFAF